MTMIVVVLTVSLIVAIAVEEWTIRRLRAEGLSRLRAGPATEDGALGEAQQEHERELRAFDAMLRPALASPPARSITGLFKQVYTEQQVYADLNADLFAVQFGRHAPDA